MSNTRRRNPNREQFWRDTLAAWRDSGQSVRAFCAARGPYAEPSGRPRDDACPDTGSCPGRRAHRRSIAFRPSV